MDFLSRALLLLLLLLVCASARHIDTTTCKDCLSRNNSRFIKSIWFPLAPFEYNCINTSEFVSDHSIVVDVLCNIKDCDYVHLRNVEKIRNVGYLSCSDHKLFYNTSAVSEGEIHKNHFCIETVEIIFVIGLILLLTVKGK